MTTAAVVTPEVDEETHPLDFLSEVDARALTERIRATIHEAYDRFKDAARLLFDARDRKAWKALGYSSFKAYTHAEFDMEVSKAYRLIDQALVEDLLEEVAGVPISVTQTAAKDIRPRLATVRQDVRERIADLPADQVPAVVDEVVREHVRNNRAVQAAADAHRRVADDYDAGLIEAPVDIDALRDAIDTLRTLPPPAEVISQIGSLATRHFATAKVVKSAEWLSEFTGMLVGSAEWLSVFSSLWEETERGGRATGWKRRDS